jgi:hypothetical protein
MRHSSAAAVLLLLLLLLQFRALARFPAGCREPPHTHSHAQELLVLSGEAAAAAVLHTIKSNTLHCMLHASRSGNPIRTATHRSCWCCQVRLQHDKRVLHHI